MVYQSLVKRFGKDNVYIGTSDVTGPKSPLSFDEKTGVMQRMFKIPAKRIVRVKSPYAPTEVLRKFDPKTTSFVTALGEKDVDRAEKMAGKYYRPFSDANSDGEGMGGYMDAGYYVTTPNFTLPNGSPISGTIVRDMLSGSDKSDEEKKRAFEDLYGSYDDSVFNLVSSKLKNPPPDTKKATSKKKADKTKASSGKKTKTKVPASHIRVRNPYTKRTILLKTALKYGKEHPAHLAAMKYIANHSVSLDEIFLGTLSEVEMIQTHNKMVDLFVEESLREECKIKSTDSPSDIRKKCKNSKKTGYYYYPLHAYYMSTGVPAEPNADGDGDGSTDMDGEMSEIYTSVAPLLQEITTVITSGYTINQQLEILYSLYKENKDRGFRKASRICELYIRKALHDHYIMLEADSSTERVRRYYKRHPKKVRAYLKKTQKDRVIRNRDRRKAVKKHGESKMKNHDVHHPKGPGGSWRLAKKDHGRDKVNEEFLLEGGAAGHMAHPYEDLDLTFAEYKKIISSGLTGGLEDEGPVTEKLDGQNIAFTVKDGRVRFARNTGHVKNSGERSLTADELKQLFAGRGTIADSFGGAADDIQAAMDAVGEESATEFFGNGSRFASVEIMTPSTENIIPYGKSILVIHNIMSYDENGEKTGESMEDGKAVADLITKSNADKQKKFGIQGPSIIAFSDADSEENNKKEEEYHAQIDELRDEFDLEDSDLVREYYIRWWARKIDDFSKERGVKLPKDIRNGLIKRWALSDKSALKLTDIKDKQLRAVIKEFETGELVSSQEESRRPFEEIFLNVGADTIKRATNLIAANNPLAGRTIRKKVNDALGAVKNADDASKVATLEKGIKRLNAIGIDKMVPSEGIVFTFKGKPFKFTGTFAPINRIVNAFGFSRRDTDDEPATPKAKGTVKPSSGRAKGKDKVSVRSAQVKPLLKHKIRNPVTGRNIYIGTALGYDKTSPAYLGAVQYIKRRLGQKNRG